MYGNLLPTEMKRLRQLEDENAKLKRIVAELSWDKAMPQDVLKKTLRPARKRQLVAQLRSDWKVSARRAYATLRVARSLYICKSRRDDQADLKVKMRDICETRVRYGYRRVHILLKREGWEVNPKRVYRLYKEMGLQLRNIEAEKQMIP